MLRGKQWETIDQFFSNDGETDVHWWCSLGVAQSTTQSFLIKKTGL